LSGVEQPRGIEVFPPAVRGAVADAVRAGYRIVGLIDGTLDHDTRVPLAELRDVLARSDVQLIGGASMGAIRAAQLDALGMAGVGRVFRLLRRRALTDGDEVFVLHAPAALRFRPLTLPLVNIRFTFRGMRRAGRITAADEAALIAQLADVPWFDRDRQAVSAAVYRACGSLRSAQVVQCFDRMYRDVKQEDAFAVIAAVRRQLQAPARAHAPRPYRGASLPARAARR
jgi:hypothetical protein